ncbi:hypothetical protein C8J57DRAFT_1712727 [Mycena rebaudengoi]|nr:hypothetical protein C8J57DRAFT_1712727 [Mycena rebaudengoi]
MATGSLCVQGSIKALWIRLRLHYHHPVVTHPHRSPRYIFARNRCCTYPFTPLPPPPPPPPSPSPLPLLRISHIMSDTFASLDLSAFGAASQPLAQSACPSNAATSSEDVSDIPLDFEVRQSGQSWYCVIS